MQTSAQEYPASQSDCSVPASCKVQYSKENRKAEEPIGGKEKLLCYLIQISNWLRKYHVDIRHLLFQNLINKRLRIIVCGGAFLDPAYVKNDLGLTAFDFINLIAILEDNFHIEFDEEAYHSIHTIGDLIDYIENAGYGR